MRRVPHEESSQEDALQGKAGERTDPIYLFQKHFGTHLEDRMEAEP